jgi:hypothetical protein
VICVVKDAEYRVRRSSKTFLPIDTFLDEPGIACGPADQITCLVQKPLNRGSICDELCITMEKVDDRDINIQTHVRQLLYFRKTYKVECYSQPGIMRLQ